MNFLSTRGGPPVTLDKALMQGIAADGGLFLPDKLPTFTADDFRSCESVTAVAEQLLLPFFEGSALADVLPDIVTETFSFPLPVRQLPVTRGNVSLLELFHGPTAAFKDVGAGFLAACLGRLNHRQETPLTILVATSGDTGGAVAAAFDGRPNVRVVVLFPDGRVSARQAHQLTCWGDNVMSLAVTGSFDDCQALVKSAFADADLASRYRFSSANSINIGRLLPQSTYYADASLRHWRATGRKPGFVIPTGNLGNALACILARDMGLPIGNIVLACNENRLIADYLGGAEWQPRKSVRTLASAMDVGNPSNMERLRALHGEAPALSYLVQVQAVSDKAIRREIRQVHDNWGITICPHTATAAYAWEQLPDAQVRAEDWIIVATAHPAKFESIVEPLTGETVPLPPSLATLMQRRSRSRRIKPSLAALASALQEGFRVDAAAAARDK